MNRSSHTRRRLTAAAAVIGLAFTAALSAPLASAQDTWPLGEEIQVSTDTLLTGHGYFFDIDVNQPEPARVYGIPEALSDQVGAQPITVVFHWGDGTSDTMNSMDDPTPDKPGNIWGNTDYAVDDSTDPPTYIPSDGFGYGMRAGVNRVFTTAGLYSVWVSASQPQPDGTTATAETPPMTVLVTNLATAASLSAKGMVYAPAGGGGMYDQDFAGGPVSFTVTAKRKAGSTATTASVSISVPNMVPDWPQTTPPPAGLEFRGTAALRPLYSAKTRTGGEVVLRRVEGRVTNTAGAAGNAWAWVHLKVDKGQPTLARIALYNTSAGFTYVDTGFNQADPYPLVPNHDLLLSGTVKIG